MRSGLYVHIVKKYHFLTIATPSKIVWNKENSYDFKENGIYVLECKCVHNYGGFVKLFIAKNACNSTLPNRMRMSTYRIEP